MLAACEPPPPPLEPVRIGILNPTTGQLGSLGPSWEDASRLAAEQINSAGGLFDGRKVELAFYDTATLPNRAAEAARQALDEGAVALVGPASSGEAEATTDVVAGFKVPQVSCCATAPSLSAADDWFFRTTPNDLLQAKAVAYVAAEGFTGTIVRAPCVEAAVVYRDDAYGTDLAQVFIEEFEGRAIAGTSPAATGRIVANVSYPSDTPDGAAVTTAFMDQLEQNHVDAVENVCVLLVSFAPDGATVVNALEPVLAPYASGAATPFSYGYLATDGLFDNAFATGAGGYSVKVVGTAPTHAENMAYETFASSFRARFGTEPGNLTSNMYDAVILLGLAITKTRSTAGADIRDALFDVSRDGRRFVIDSGPDAKGAFFGEMAEALLSGEDIDYVGPSGELDFDASGDVIGDFSLWQPISEAGAFTIKERDFLPSSTFAP